MKDIINFYYNFNVINVEDWQDFYTFFYNEEKFYLVPLKRSIEELIDLVNISKELKLKGFDCHDLILNRYGKLVTNIYEINYVLIKPLKDAYKEFEISDMIKINNSLILKTQKSNLYRNYWAKLWSDKVDYFEYQIHELGKNKNVVLDSFSYYVGLAENAISYVNATNEKYKKSAFDRICLSHRRINYPNYKLNYFNPLNFVFDLEVRDIAEYIKSSFFAGGDALNYLKETLKITKLSIYSLQLLFARLLYPSYYFDIYEKVMNNLTEEEKLIGIIEKANEYEDFLKDCYFEIIKVAPIESIYWLINKK